MEFRSALQLRADFAAGRATSVEVIERVLGGIEAINDKLGAYYTSNKGAYNAAVAAR
jgi:Asp-tRNA(Asn)/Glu-tRNA(Gln) amidotransferase A subunit family amidase